MLDVDADGSKLPTCRRGGMPISCRWSWWSRRRWRATSTFSYREWRGKGVCGLIPSVGLLHFRYLITPLVLRSILRLLEGCVVGTVGHRVALLPTRNALDRTGRAVAVAVSIAGVNGGTLTQPSHLRGLFGHSGTVAQPLGSPVSSEYPPEHKRSDNKYWLTDQNVSPAHRTANLKKWPGAHYPLSMCTILGGATLRRIVTCHSSRPDPTRLASQQTTPLVATATTRNSAYHMETVDQRSISHPGANGLTLCLHTPVRCGSRCTVSATCKASRTIATHGALRLQTSRGCHGRTPVTLTRRSPLSWMATFGSSTAPTGSLTLAPPRLTANNG